MATAEALYDRIPELEIHFVGVFGGEERQYVDQFDLPLAKYSEILAGPIHGLSLFRKLRSVILLGLGTLQSLQLLLNNRPHVLLLTGGWMGFPVALAAWMLRVPSVMYLPDLEPGLAIRTLAPLVKRVAIHVEESKKFFTEDNCSVVGYPLRKSFMGYNRSDGVKKFNLNKNKRTLLVFGGSLGARILNQTILLILPDLISDGWQILHVTGKGNWEETISSVAYENYDNYFVFPYLDEIGLAAAAADLTVSRAGASVLAENSYYSTPSILVPLAHQWRYQQINAQYLADRGVAIVLNEDELPNSLLETIRSLINNDGERLMQMRRNFSGTKTQNSSELLADELMRAAI